MSRMERDALFVAMSLKEVLEETGRSKRTVLRWVSEGRLKKYRLEGEEIFIRRDVLKVEAQTARRNVPERPGAVVAWERYRQRKRREANGGRKPNPLEFHG
jgi:excisionase family DNA binding protein